MDTGEVTQLETKYDGNIFLINKEYVGIVKDYNLIVQSLIDDDDNWDIKLFSKAHDIKQILLKDKCL